MALKLTKSDLAKGYQRAESLKKRVANLREKGEEVTGKIVRTVESGTAAFAMGVVQGKTGGVEIVGVPLELGLGASLTLFDILGLGGKMSSHLGNFGTGCLDAYLTTIGRGVGQSWEEKSGDKQLAGGQSQLSSKGVDLSPAELAIAAQMAANGG